MHRKSPDVTVACVLIVFTGYGVAAERPERPVFPAVLFENHGQAAPEVRFILKGTPLNTYYRNDEILFHSGGAPIRLRFGGANASVQVAALDRLDGQLNFITGKDPARWARNLPVYSGLLYRGLYAGIDMRWLVRDGLVKSEFVLAPGADSEAIQLHYSGMTSIQIETSGSLLLCSSGGMIRENAPEAYTTHEGFRKTVRARFRLSHNGEVGFDIGPYDHNATLVIDPTLSYSTFLGGSGHSGAASIAVDGSGNAYIAGWTESLDFPVTGGLPRGSGVDGFVAKFTSSNTLAYCTYIGGSNEDRVTGIAVDTAGNAVMAGYTTSTDMPFNRALQPTLRGTRNAFIAKLNASGTALLFGTYLGGSGVDAAAGIALDTSGNVYVAGTTTSPNFPTQNGFQPNLSGQQDGFVSKLDSTGTTLLYSTFLGGSNIDTIAAIAVDLAGNAYVAGNTLSADFPVAAAFHKTIPGQESGFVTKISSNGQALVYSTFLGGSGGSMLAPESVNAIAVDATGAAYVTGVTSSVDFPVVNAYQTLSDGGTHGFVTKFDSTGAVLVFSSYFGGSGRDWPMGITVSTSASVYLCGYTSSSDFPVLNAIQVSNAGIYDAFVARFNSIGRLVHSSYLGGSSIDSANAITIDGNGNIYLAGHTMSTNFPLASPFQSTNMDDYSAFLTKVTDTASCCKSAPELVWQNDTTRQVTVNYYGGAGGATLQGWNWLDAQGIPGWHVVAAADFNGDGVPDLVWMNDTTRQVTVHYYGGTGGATLQGWNWLNSAGVPTWSIVN